jgi:glycerophosphoryl diester phosphodiesterase
MSRKLNGVDYSDPNFTGYGYVTRFPFPFVDDLFAEIGTQQNAASPRPAVEIIAHRGFSNAAPENTLASASAAVGLAHSLEGDVQFSSDHLPVVIHDTTIDRTCAPSTGNVTAFTRAALQALDAGTWFDARWANTRVPTFEDWLAFGAAHYRYLYPEIKGYNSTADIQVFVQTIQALGVDVEARCVVQSFQWGDFTYVRQYSPRVTLGYLCNSSTDVTNAIPLAQADGRAVLLVNYTVLLATPSYVAQIRAAGADVIAWTVDQIDVMRQLLAIGVRRQITSLCSQELVAL